LRAVTGALSYAYVPATFGGFGLRRFRFLFGGFGIAFRLPAVPGGAGGVASRARMLPSKSSGSFRRSRLGIEQWRITLNRVVALKILPDLFASDPDRLARVSREAQTLTALNHPGIAQIYGSVKVRLKADTTASARRS
jgi:serine/threonine protein kinase